VAFIAGFARQSLDSFFWMMGTMMRASTGSAHHSQKEGIEQQPGKKDAGQVVQNSFCLASACMAALPSARPILRLARESSGITIPEKLKTVHVSYTAIWGRDSNAVPFPRPQPLLGDAKTLK
jgi:hypothetical protein